MSFSAGAADERVQDVAFSDDALSVSLRDGRVITVPLVWYSRLLNATPAQRKNWKIAGGGYAIHWPEVDEDLSTEGLLRGAPAPGYRSNASSGLSGREQLVVGLIVDGLSNKEIANQLQISEQTVRAHIQRVFRRLGVASKLAVKEVSFRHEGSHPEPVKFRSGTRSLRRD